MNHPPRGPAPLFVQVRKAIADGIEAGIESWVSQYKAYKSFEPISIDYAGISQRITVDLFRAAASGGERETDVVAMYGAVFDDGSLWDQLFFTPEAAQRYIDNECSADGVMRVERVWPLAALRASGEREKDADPMTYNKVLRELGARLADLLDADHWNNIEPMLHALASSGERDGEVTPEDRAWLEREATRIERNVAEYEASGNAELVIGAKTIAPTAARWRRILAALSSRQETP